MSQTVRRLLGAAGTTVAAGAAALTALPAAAGTAWTATPASAGGALHSEVVIARPGHLAGAVAAVRAAGGTIGTRLPIVSGFTAKVSAAATTALNHDADIVSVTADRSLAAADASWGGYNPATAGASYAGSTRATNLWDAGDKGQGVTVAVLDTGVYAGGDLAGRVVKGPDFSGEGNSLQDSYGHGTVMAGLIAGSGAASQGAYPGIAPQANIVSVKVAGRSGATDVSQVLAGLQWIGSFAEQYGIKVVSLSYGTPSTQSDLVDPLDYAVERLWGMGITVVVSAGNDGGGAMTITDPGNDPAVITVGAFDDAGTAGTTSDDAVTNFSSRGPTVDGDDKPDLVSPGRTLVAQAAPGSAVVQAHPQSLVGGGAYITGSGTSQATAVTAGGVALLLQQHPGWTPDQVKYAFTSTARDLGDDPEAQGAGELRINRATGASVGAAPAQSLDALGVGSLEQSRGGEHVWTTCPGSSTPTEIVGEVDAHCDAWSSDSWSSDSWSSDSWSSDSWSSDSWSSDSWSSDSWSSDSWSSDSWSSDSWSSDSWSSFTWDPAPRTSASNRAG